MSLPGGGAADGTYTPAVTQQPDDFPANTTTPGAVPVGGTAPDRIEAEGNHDWFAVTLVAGADRDWTGSYALYVAET